MIEAMSPEGTSVPDYRILAFRFINSGQWDRSLATAYEWLAKDPENTQAHRIAAQSLINLDRQAEARKHLERALAGNPSDDFTHRMMSMVHFEQGRFKEADESIRKAIGLDPNDAYNWHQLARMNYKKGYMVAARKCAEKARELNPLDPDVLNLLILCEPNGPDQTTAKIRRYQEALELDPENANIHNNIGAEYLDGLKDYAKAEECFRRALFFNPASKLIRRNLLVTVKHRDPVYRTLCAPKDLLFKVVAGIRKIRKKSVLLYILIIPFWLVVFRFVLGGLILWFALIWPMTKVYEFLTVGDIRARMGEVGARRGGFLGYRQWSLMCRLLLFGFLLVTFWGGLVWICLGDDASIGAGTRDAVWKSLILVGGLVFAGYWLKSARRAHVNATAARKSARQINEMLDPGTIRRRWWQFFGTNSKSP